jgi:hypothetical protein
VGKGKVKVKSLSSLSNLTPSIVVVRKDAEDSVISWLIFDPKFTWIKDFRGIFTKDEAVETLVPLGFRPEEGWAERFGVNVRLGPAVEEGGSVELSTQLTKAQRLKDYFSKKARASDKDISEIGTKYDLTVEQMQEMLRTRNAPLQQQWKRSKKALRK